jgi:alpha-L-fucosidase
MNRVTAVLAGILVAAVLAPAAFAGEPADPLKPDPAALQKWQDMRFGMFIHWGPVSIKGTEIGWSRGAQVPQEEYDNLYKQFNPTLFNADEWVQVAKDAGMKYLVITTKHHDGFCIFDTKQTDYNIMKSPFGRDAVKELAAACRKQGIAFGTYYSVCDWHHPDFPRGSPGGRTQKPNPNIERYTEYLKNQVAELVRQYGPLITLWYDVPQEFGGERGKGVLLHTRALQPDILINNRTGGGGDYDTPEQKIGGFNMTRPWETCMTICHQWAWKPNDAMKSLKQCLQTLVATNGGNGNLLFNVGPMPDGRIEPRQVERLKEMGEWLKKHGESVYGTRGGPYKPGPWGASTRKGDRVYLHVFKWDGETVKLPALPAQVKSARLLAGGAVECKATEEGLTLTVPAANQDPIDTVVELTIDRPAMDLAPVAAAAGASAGASAAKASASNVYQKNEEYGADKAVDGNEETRWATDGGTKAAWLELDLGKPVAIGRVAIDECDEWGKRIRKFELQVREGDAWKTVLEGTEVGRGFAKEFAPVTAQRVRLNILEATEGPTIWEFSVFPPKSR